MHRPDELRMVPSELEELFPQSLAEFKFRV
jgi:hypothetical protein